MLAAQDTAHAIHGSLSSLLLFSNPSPTHIFFGIVLSETVFVDRCSPSLGVAFNA